MLELPQQYIHSSAKFYIKGEPGIFPLYAVAGVVTCNIPPLPVA